MYHSRFQGGYYEAGLRCGVRLRQKGEGPFAKSPPEAQRKAFSKACLAAYEAYYPEILQEIKGMADGLALSFETAAEFLFSMYSYTAEQHCSCAAMVGGGEILLLRNSDFAVWAEKLCDSVLYRMDGAYAFVGNTTAWTEIEDGVNEWGLAIGLTFVYPTQISPGFGAGLLLRYLLEKCRTVEEALAALRRLPIASAQTLTLADRTGAAALVECNCKEIAVISPSVSSPYVFATNHFVSKTLAPYQYKGEDTVYSHLRRQTLERALKKARKVSVDFARGLLAGEYGFLCQYDRTKGMDTVWSSIYDLKRMEIYRAEGNPSRKPFVKDSRLSFRTEAL